METDKVVEEDEHGTEVVGNVRVEDLHADVLNPVQRLDRHLAGEVTVAYNGAKRARIFHNFQYGESLRAVPAVVDMEAGEKTRLAAPNEPETVFPALYLNDSFIGVPLVGVEIERRKQLYGNVLEYWGDTGTPVAGGSRSPSRQSERRQASEE